MTADQLSEQAGMASRWSLRRFLKDDDASITLKTAIKLEEAMERIESQQVE